MNVFDESGILLIIVKTINDHENATNKDISLIILSWEPS